ncbi:MAG TPA: lysylphosphatidylglycerol synthase transmembrane domain-containing protein [Candidatus Gracilibacteria bacterium]|nr:lysylphosphatidylglycerol synthase transmembrane domain-containing protein [Candidatus Gracilibacteria bacterium]
MKLKRHLLILAVFLTLGIALFVGMIINTGVDKIWGTLSQFSLLKFLVFLAVSTLNFVLYTLRWDIILKKIHGQPHQIRFFRLFLHRMSGFALSYLTPSAQTGGEPLRIMLLEHDNIPTKTATSSVIIDKALEFAALFVFIGIGMLMAIFDGSLPQATRTVFTILLVVILLVIFWFYYSSLKNIGVFSSILRITRLNRFARVKKLEEKMMAVESQMADFYKHHLKTFIILIVISLIISSFLLLEHYLVARFMGVNLTFFQTFLASTIPYIAYVIPVPGGLGLLEGGHAAIFAALGVNINAFVLVFIIRMRDLVFVLAGLVHASKRSLSLLKQTYKNNTAPGAGACSLSTMPK